MNKPKLTLSLLVALGFLTSTTIAQSNATDSDKDNGGSIIEMQKTRAFATEEALADALSKNSQVLKQALEGLVSYLPVEEIDDPVVKERFQRMLDSGKLLNDVRYVNYSICPAAFDQYCSEEKYTSQACTKNATDKGDTSGATIYFNVKELFRNRTSMADLIGLLMHEHSRHFIGNDDHDHQVANYFATAFIQGKYKGRVFSSPDLVQQLSNAAFKRTYGYRYGVPACPPDVDIPQLKKYADAFCQSKDYFSSANSSQTLTGDHGIWHFSSFHTFDQDSIKTKSPLYVDGCGGKIWVFNSITCIKNADQR